MRKQYYFSKAKRNPYARRLKQQITTRLDRDPREFTAFILYTTG